MNKAAEKLPEAWRILTANKKFTAFDEKKETNYQGPFYFIQGADTQFGFIQSYLGKSTVPDWSEEIALTELAVEKINQLQPRPRFFVMCGDLCDAFPDTSPDIRKEQEKDFKRIFNKLHPSIPLVCVCGNHDVGNQPTKDTVASYRSSFGDDYFSFWCGGVLFLVLNSQYYHDPSLVPELASEQEEWLDRMLEEASVSGNRVIVFQHVPWFVSRPEETDSGYFALPAEVRGRLLEKLRLAGVTHVFAGHYHRNAGGWYKGLEMVVTSAVGGQLGDDKSGVRIVQCSQEKVQHAYYSLENIPATVDLQNM